MDYVRTSSQTSKQLTIVVHDNAVTFTDVDGGIQTLETDDKSVSERAENGLVRLSRKTHWQDSALVSEINVENGPKIVRTYSLSPAATQLRITTSVEGAGRPANVSNVYERPVESR